MQKGFVPILILIAVLLIAGVGGGAYYFGRLTAPKNENIPTVVTSQNAPSLPPVVDEITNWKTYTNTEYYFSIKYPSDWVETEIGEFDYSPSFQSPNIKADSYVPHLISGSWMDVGGRGSQYKTLDEVEEDLQSRKGPGVSGPRLVSIERLKFAGQDAIKSVTHYDARSLMYSLFMNNKGYYINCQSPIGDDQALKLCEKIANTFKFL